MSIFVPPGLSPIDDDPQIDLTPLIDCLFHAHHFLCRHNELFQTCFGNHAARK